MCNFVPVRNWLIALSIIAAAAISSAILAGIFSSLPFPLNIVGSICFWAAVTWCTLGTVMSFFAYDALKTYCRCIVEGAASRCAPLCAETQVAVASVAFFFFLFGAVCIFAALQGAGPYVWHLVVTGLALLASLVAAAWYGGSTEDCRPIPV